MAEDEIKISEYPERVLIDLTDDAIFEIVDEGVNYKLPISTLAEYIDAKIEDTSIIGEMSLTSVSQPQTFDGSSFTKITSFNKIQYERGVDVDVDTDSISILTPKDYRITLSINAEFSNNQGVEFALLQDGVPAETLGTIQGRGTGKPVYIGGADIDPLTIGNVLSVGAREDSGASVDIIFHKVRLTVEEV